MGSSCVKLCSSREEGYRGETKNGERHGHGIYTYSNGDIYDGEWRKSKKYGRGVYTYSNGDKLEGFFYNDDFIGALPNEEIAKRMAKKQKKYEKTNTVPLPQRTMRARGPRDRKSRGSDLSDERRRRVEKIRKKRNMDR